ncbi:glycosyltransferase [Plantibacter sp. VKM Ac-2885]|uniref:glycosyltransferase n=1 Tax=Plantibacter sp. VKM Ac-2885 TaxID=2783828 RepID=UPI001889FC5F|nr:glycosyltransferase [Plantibacter sp. VKM Ac-2885]MBF4514084.1 glycosyltransferase [Plantibacter sp. VKM Ac-2885]
MTHEPISSTPSVTVQSVLFHTPPEAIERALEATHRAAEIGWLEKTGGAVVVSFGDCSPTPTLTESWLRVWRDRFPSLSEIRYEFFGENLGHGGAQNRIAASTTSDYLVIANPDIVISPRAIQSLLKVFADPAVGIAEAKQLPLEHPKDYDSRTGATSWAAGAYSMFPTRLFKDIGGFDAESFFMYCDDVDLSWRIREVGRKIVFQPGASVFHAKTLSENGRWRPTSSERYFSAEAALLLTYKWSRPDLTDQILSSFDASGDLDAARAAREFRSRMERDALPEQRDPHHRTAEFTDGNYATHRFVL